MKRSKRGHASGSSSISAFNFLVGVMKVYANVLSGRSDLEFNLVGGPLEAPDDHSPLFAALGFAGSAWARMEQQLDIVLIHINKEKLSSRLYQPEYPIAFERKIKLAKRWFNQHPPLKPYRDDIRLFTSKVKEIAPIRNHLLHSILQDWNPKEQVATMQTIKFEGNDKFRVRSRGVHLKTIKTFGTSSSLTSPSKFSQMPHYAFEDLGGGFNFVTQFGSNLVVALAKMAIRSGEAL
jgi:hypothetical protein